MVKSSFNNGIKTLPRYIKYLTTIIIIALGLIVSCELTTYYKQVDKSNVLDLKNWEYIQTYEVNQDTAIGSKIGIVLSLKNWAKIQIGNKIEKKENFNTIWLRAKLPEDNYSSTIYFDHILENYTIYLNDKAVLQHFVDTSDKASNLWNQNLIPLTKVKKGDYLVLAISINNSKYFSLPRIFYGSSAEIVKNIFIMAIPSVLILAMLFITSFGLIVLFILLEKSKIYLGLSLFLLSLGTWTAVNNAFFQLIVNLPKLFFHLNYFSFQSSGIFFFVILEYVVNQKFKKIINIVWKTKIALLIISIIIINSIDFRLMKIYNILFILNISFILIGVVSLLVSFKKSQPKHRIIISGMIGVLISILIEYSFILNNHICPK